ncbi:MAG: hypothetical protein ACXADA_07220 [Candidatus Hodarchaeales archaeon]
MKYDEGYFDSDRNYHILCQSWHPDVQSQIKVNQLVQGISIYTPIEISPLKS